MEPIFRIDLRDKYRHTLLSKWSGRDLSAQHRFIESDDDSVMMAFTLPEPFKTESDLVIESTDGGETWDYYRGPRHYPPHSLGIWRRGHFRIAIRGGDETFLSTDDGYTWGPARRILSADDLHFDGLGRPNTFSGIMIDGGSHDQRIVLVADYFMGQEGPDEQCIGAVFSDDWGITWHASRLTWPADPLPKGPEGFGEPAVVQMRSGWLWMVFRTPYGELWQCISRDGGQTWNHPTPTGLASPIANCSAKRDPYTGYTVLCWNLTKPGISEEFRSRHSLYRPRTNLVFAVSKTNCRTWTVPVVVDAGHAQYPTIHFTEDRMFIMCQTSKDEHTSWADCGLQLTAWDREEVMAMPDWDTETIQPLIKKGLVAHWLALACRPKSRQTID